MKKLLLAAAAAVLAAGMLSADHHESKYETIASVHDLMADIVKPNMDKLGAMRKAGGPQDEKQWKQAHRAASVLGEGIQLSMMGGRVKDDAWADGGKQSIQGAKDAMAAAKAMDSAAWMKATGAISGGCRTCHKVHKPKK